jgi:ribosome-associated translation inhibitor RaiA
MGTKSLVCGASEARIMIGSPVFQNALWTIRANADNADIRHAIVKAVPVAKKQLEKIANNFKGSNDAQTCKNIYDWLFNKVPYKADGEDQTIKFPSALMKPGMKADCKSYALFTAGILENLKIPYTFVLASYNENPIPGHIYVKTKPKQGKGCIIDAVWGHSGGSFDSEKPANYKYEIPMNVKYMAGIGCADCGGTCQDKGVGNIFDRFGNWVKEKVDDTFAAINKTGNKIDPNFTKNLDKAKAALDKAAKAVTKAEKDIAHAGLVSALAPGRGLFRIIISANIDGLATTLSLMNKGFLDGQWKSVGGDPVGLWKSINEGKNKKVVKMGFFGSIKKNAKIAGCGLGDTKSDIQAALLALGPTIGTLIGSVVPGAGTVAGAAAGTSLGAVLAALTPLVLEIFKNTPAADLAKSMPNIDATIPTDEIDNSKGAAANNNAGAKFWDQTTFGINNKTLIGGAVLLTIGIIVAKKQGIKLG